MKERKEEKNLLYQVSANNDVFFESVQNVEQKKRENHSRLSSNLILLLFVVCLLPLIILCTKCIPNNLLVDNNSIVLYSL